jgi:amidase
MRPGWSSYGGMTLSPYVGPLDPKDKILGHSMPGGSSVGSAMAVAAGYAPLAIGVETSGSIVTPSVRAGLYAMKPTLNLVPMDGVLGLTRFFDSLGPMGKSAQDIEDGLLDMIGASEGGTTLKEALKQNNEASGWKGMRLGFGDPDIWFINDDFCEQIEGSKEHMVSNFFITLFKHPNLLQW